jgi:hypothetical protein
MTKEELAEFEAEGEAEFAAKAAEVRAWRAESFLLGLINRPFDGSPSHSGYDEALVERAVNLADLLEEELQKGS